MFEQIIDKENLLCAFEKTLANIKSERRHRYEKYKKRIVKFLSQYMGDLSWQMIYREPFIINEGGKKREIICCSFKDRVAQQAMLNVCEPIFKKCMINNSYQAQKGKGIHKASLKIRKWIKDFSKDDNNVYFLHIDIKKYYQSIDSEIMLRVLSKKIKCEKTLKLFEIALSGDIYGRGKGVTLGNNISQWLGNMYLYDYDHDFCKYKNTKYLRYADDMIFISNDKALLHQIKKDVSFKLHLRKLKMSKCVLGQITDNFCLNTLGFKFFKNRVAIRKKIKHNLSKAYAKKKSASVASLRGMTKWANCRKMEQNMEKQYMKNVVKL